MSEESKEETIKQQLTLAKRSLSAGNYEKAEECYSKALDYDMNNLEAIVGQACAAARQSSVQQSRFEEMVTAVDTIQSIREEVGDDKCKPALVQLMEQFVEMIEPLIQGILDEKNRLGMQKFMNSGLVQAGRGNAAAKSMDFKDAFKKIMPQLAKAEFAFFKKFNEEEAVKDPVLKDAYLKLAQMVMLHCSGKYQLTIGVTAWQPAFPDICAILEKTEKGDKKDYMGKLGFQPTGYGKMLASRLQQYYPEGTKLPGAKGGCYVATAVYGSYDCPEVWVLRRYRDNTLAASVWGRAFIRFYYAVSPTLVKWFGQTQWFKALWKGRLDRMVRNLKAQGVSDKPYCD